MVGRNSLGRFDLPTRKSALLQGYSLREFSMADDYTVDEVRRLREEQTGKHGFEMKSNPAAARKRRWRSM